MRFVKLACLALLLCALSLVPTSAGGGKARKGKNHTVEMHDNFFKPKDITISVGDTITWVNKGEKSHTATADKKTDPNYFDTKTVDPGKKSKAIEFKHAAKKVPYHCEYHKKMKGTITVKEKAEP